MTNWVYRQAHGGSFLLRPGSLIAVLMLLLLGHVKFDGFARGSNSHSFQDVADLVYLKGSWW